MYFTCFITPFHEVWLACFDSLSINKVEFQRLRSLIKFGACESLESSSLEWCVADVAQIERQTERVPATILVERSVFQGDIGMAICVFLQYALVVTVAGEFEVDSIVDVLRIFETVRIAFQLIVHNSLVVRTDFIALFIFQRHGGNG